MKTKNVLRVLAIAFAMVLMLAIASCDLLKPEVTTTAHVHSETILAAVEANCTETGLTEGKKCTTCGQVTVPQQVVPAKGHTEEVVDAVEATCTSIGLTEGKKCAVCDVTLVRQEQIPVKEHTPEDVKAVDPTCTQQGFTAGKKCSVCDTVLEAQEPIAAKGHKEETIKGIAATCSSIGLTDGKKCTVCGETTVAQTVIDKLPHTPGAAATCTAAQTCTVCNTELAAKIAHSYDRYEDNDDERFNNKWGICTVCGYVDPNHEHIMKDGLCQHCNVAFFTMPVISIYDANEDGQNDIFYMANSLPERFRAEGAIHINAVRDDKAGKGHRWDEYGSKGNRCPYAQYYVSDRKNHELNYEVTVTETGVYELAIHVKLKDLANREATFTIIYEDGSTYTFRASYGYNGKPDVAPTGDHAKLVSDTRLVGSYIYGIVVQLKAGTNKIRVTADEAKLAPKTMHLRDLYFVKWDCKNDKIGHAAYAEGKCIACGTECAHDWVEATCVAPKTCKICALTEGKAAEGHQLDENYKCTVCHKNFLLTLEEAWELGTKCDNGKDKCDTTEIYYIQITLDAQVNPNGFARGTLVVGEKYISIDGGYLTGDAEGSIKLGDTVILKGNLGAVANAAAKSGKEARLFFASVVKNLSEGCEHTYGEEIVLVPVAPTCCDLGKGVVKCTKCAGAKTVDIKALGHDLVEGVCSRCGTSELNDDDKAWLTAQGLDADKYLKLDLKFNMNQYYNPTNNNTGGKWVNDGGSHEMATRIITKAEMGAGSVVRIDHIAKDENGKWATMIQYRPEFFISSTGKCVAAARQSGVKVGGMLEVTDEWWKGITDGRKSDMFDRISFSLTVLDVTAVADEDSKYTTTPDKTYALSEADYDNFVIYVLKPAQ